jgi:short-subunit dehydrogenase
LAVSAPTERDSFCGMKLAGKVLVVTGGGNGIGREIVLHALQRGARVAAIDLRRESLDETAALAGAAAPLSTHVVDITDRARCAALPSEVVARHGAVDGIINNAGILHPFSRIADLELEAIERVVNVNFYGTLNMITAFLPTLRERPEAHIANVSSMGGFLPVPGQAIYCATKAAVKMLTEALYGELLDTNIGVSVVMPGAIRTDIMKNSGLSTPGMAEAAAQSHAMTEPAQAARIILDGIEHGRLHVFVGADSRFMHLALRLAPKRAVRQMSRLILKQMKPLLDRPLLAG